MEGECEVRKGMTDYCEVEEEMNLDTMLHRIILNVVLHITYSCTIKCNLCKYENYFTNIITEYVITIISHIPASYFHKYIHPAIKNNYETYHAQGTDKEQITG
jgi:hypothetical protein